MSGSADQRKAAHAARVRQWRTDSREKYLAGRKRWSDANKEKIKAYRDAHKEEAYAHQRAYRRQRKTGWTPEQYDAKLAEQGGRCAICEREPHEAASHGKRLAADHCHKTGATRGLLCHKCNTAIGKLGDDLDGVMRAVRYLTRYGG